MKNDFIVMRKGESLRYRLKIVFEYSTATITLRQGRFRVRTVACLLYLYNEFMPLPKTLTDQNASQIGHSYCSPTDIFTKVAGRRVALADALKSLPRFERAQIWENYLYQDVRISDTEIIRALEQTLVEILECNVSKYSDPIEAIDAIYAIAFRALPEGKRPKGTPNLIVSQIGLGKALSGRD